MAAERPPATRLAEHDAALTSLLESLLAEVPGHQEGTPAAQTVACTTPADSGHVVAAQQKPLKPSGQTPLTKSVADERSLPAWAAEAFRALMFRIGRFHFAMPLVLMRGVTPLPEARARVPGAPRWHAGVLRVRGNSVTGVDLGALVGIDTGRVEPRYLLLIADGRVALLCDAVAEAVLVEPARVRWYRARRGRGWMAGVLSDEMCLLLDAAAIAEMIRHG